MGAAYDQYGDLLGYADGESRAEVVKKLREEFQSKIAKVETFTLDKMREEIDRLATLREAEKIAAE